MEESKKLSKQRITSSRYKVEEAYWLKKMSPPLNLSSFPPDYPNGNEERGVSLESMSIDFDEAMCARLMKLGNQSDLRLHMVLLAAVTALLSKYGNSVDLVVGIPILRQEAAVKFVNTILPIRCTISEEMSFKGLLMQVRTSILEATTHQNYPMDLLSSQLNVSLFDVTVLLDNIHDPSYIEGIHTNTGFAFTRKNESVSGRFIFDNTLYESTTAQRIIRHFRYLMGQLLDHVDTPIVKLDLFSAEEKKHLLDQLDRSSVSFPLHETVLSLFDRQVQEHPHRVALVSEGSQFSYNRLNEQANLIASYIAGKGIVPGFIVALLLSRSHFMIIAILATLKAGASYLPIDPQYPEERIDYMLNDSAAQGIVVDDTTEVAGQPQRVTLNVESTILGHEHTSPPVVQIDPQHPAYIIYTSGTTGKPKGVMVSHRNIVRLMKHEGFLFDFSRGDIWTMFHSYCFDFSVWEMYGALLLGGRLVVVTKKTAQDPPSFRKLLLRHSVTVLNQTPSAFYNLLREDMNIAQPSLCLRYVIFGGEALQPARLKDWKLRYPLAKLVNMFGITETTVHVTYKEVVGRTIERSASNIGVPLPTLSVRLLDNTLALVPPGVTAELFVGGSGVALGYLNRPELTAQRFLQDPYVPKMRLYRSGDLGRLTADGDIEYLGRADQQVQVRGYRVELGEVEATVLRYPEVSETVVVIVDSEDSHQLLVCYVVGLDSMNIGELRNFLGETLPDYMIPHYFVPIDRIPLTSNGKVDRAALPDPRVVNGETYLAPRDEVERKLVSIWEEALDLEQVGIDDSFFQVGGDSIRAIRLLSDVNSGFGSNLLIADLFANETVAQLAMLLKDGAGISRDPALEEAEAEVADFVSLAAEQELMKDEWEDVFPMSDIQKGMIFHYLKDRGKAVYHDQMVHQMKYRDFEPDVFHRAMELMVRKHAVLRTAFNMYDFPEPVQVVYKTMGLDTGHRDVSHLDPKEQEALINSVIAQDRADSLNISEPPLWRIRTFTVGPEDVVILWVCHHAIIDGWSDATFKTELNNVYLGLKEDSSFCPQPLKNSYKTFVIEQLAEKKREETIAYWREELRGYKRLTLKQETAGETESDEMGHVGYDLGEEFFQTLREVAGANNTTVKNLCFAAYVGMLNMVAFEPDVTVGLVCNNRPVCEDGDKMLGCFLNTVPVRFKIPSQVRWTTFVHNVDETLRTLKKYERLSFMEIVKQLGEETGHQNPIFDTVFNYVDFHVYKQVQPEDDSRRPTGGGDDELELRGFVRANTHLNMNVDVTLGTFFVSISFTPSFVSRDMVEQLCGYFRRILNLFVSEPTGILAKGELLDVDEKHRLLETLNNTQRDWPPAMTIPQWFGLHNEKHPGRVAAIFEDLHLTYDELGRRSARLAEILREKGAGPDRIVGLLMRRSLEMVVGIMGVLMSGGAYLPLDPEAPACRVETMLRQSDSQCLLADSSILGHCITELRNLYRAEQEVRATNSAANISDLDDLPLPDRSLVDYQKYNRYIGQSLFKHSVTMLGARGCPFGCAYCHKIWPKKQVARSAENMFAEVQTYYKMGVRRFVFLDDVFNLNVENSRRFFHLLIERQLDLNLSLCLRGDILTPEYIDLMVKAGTVRVALALETASPRLQTLIGKRLNIEAFRRNIQYIAQHYPQVILEINTMHGFPSETEEEALLTLEFIKSIRWIHFPYVNILKIYPNTAMESIAVQNGISLEAIQRSSALGYHELSETLPFSRSFTHKYQAEFLNGYFLDRERLLQVLPFQMKVLTEDEIVQKYNSYLPVNIEDLDGLLEFLDIDRGDLGVRHCLDENAVAVPEMNEKLREHFGVHKSSEDALRVLLLDVTQLFSGEAGDMLYDVVEAPLGLMYVMTYLQECFGERVNGRIAKSRIDYDSFPELRHMINECLPDVIGIRALTFYKDFFHRTVTVLRQWGYKGIIVAGGPYATSDYRSILQDPGIDVAVLGEGEETFRKLVGKIIDNHKALPPRHELEVIDGLAFPSMAKTTTKTPSREVVLLDQIDLDDSRLPSHALCPELRPSHLAYSIFTSGSTGVPKGVGVEHRNVYNLVRGLEETIYNRYPEGLRVGLLAPYVFDASIKQLFGSLLLGHSLYLLPREVVVDGERLLRYYRSRRLEISDGTPSHLRLLLECFDEAYDDLCMKNFIIGGEALSKPLVERFFATYQSCESRITNIYGITECCVDSTLFEATPVDMGLGEAVPIGRPMPNQQVYILDSNQHLQPFGVRGELCIGGENVSRGYLDVSAEKEPRFVENPFAGEGNMYKTGDMGRWLADGTIEFAGRIDSQVKVRGYRIELGEIENRLLEYGAVCGAVVLARQNRFGEHVLYAYCVSDRQLDAAEMKDFLSRWLPDYMIPSFFISIPELPLTSHGKIDVRALPEPVIDGENDGLLPEGPLQLKLAEIWEEVLEIDNHSIKLDSDFFELGGDSLKVAILGSRIHKVFDVRVPLSDIFETPTLRELSDIISSSTKERYVSLDSSEKKEYYQLSSAQKRLYFLQQLNPSSTDYNLTNILLIEGEVNKERLEYAFSKLIDRHESFRTAIEIIDNQPVQRMYGSVDFEVEYAESSEGQVSSLIENTIKPFDLGKAPFLRVKLIAIGPQKYILFVEMHHILTDGVSHNILMQEFVVLYSGQELPPIQFQYKDYTELQNRQGDSDFIVKQEEYWLASFQDEVPELRLPTDFEKSEANTMEGESVDFVIDESTYSKIKSKASSIGATTFMFLLAVFNIMLSKYSDQEDITIGIPIEGRGHEDLKHIIGFFVNILPMRNHPVGSRKFMEFLREVRATAVQSFENQNYPFDELVNKLGLQGSKKRNPLFDCVLNMNKVEDNRQSDAARLYKDIGFTIDPFVYERTVLPFDLFINAIEDENTIYMNLNYTKALFKKSTAERIGSHFMDIIRQVLEDPDIRLADIRLTHQLLESKPNRLRQAENQFDFSLSGI